MSEMVNIKIQTKHPPGVQQNIT